MPSTHRARRPGFTPPSSDSGHGVNPSPMMSVPRPPHTGQRRDDMISPTTAMATPRNSLLLGCTGQFSRSANIRASASTASIRVLMSRFPDPPYFRSTNATPYAGAPPSAQASASWCLVPRATTCSRPISASSAALHPPYLQHDPGPVHIDQVLRDVLDGVGRLLLAFSTVLPAYFF